MDIEKGIYKFYDIPKGVIVYTPARDGSKYLRFKFHDGKFAYLTTYAGNIVFLPVETVLERHRNGFTIKGKTVVDIPPGKVALSDTAWHKEEEQRDDIYDLIRKCSYPDLQRELDNYTELVCDQLDDRHTQYLDVLLEIVREQVLRERIILGSTAPEA
jgi:hypothetical protein